MSAEDPTVHGGAPKEAAEAAPTGAMPEATAAAAEGAKAAGGAAGAAAGSGGAGGDGGGWLAWARAAALRVLREGDPFEKARLTDEFVAAWKARSDADADEGAAGDGAGADDVPDVPARPAFVEEVHPSRTKTSSKRGMVHALVHAESWAIDLMWDLIARFAAAERMPRAFVNDWVTVAGEEAKHFRRWRARLRELSGGKDDYGCMAAHAGLWESAQATSDSLLARLAVVHGVHEARGLDTAPQARAKLLRSNPPDTDSVEILDGNVAEEVGHVGRAVRWFKWLCERDGVDPVDTFHSTVRARFAGVLKPPFNAELREAAGMTEEWYVPLTRRDE